jgi:hypothetical protein
MKRSIVLILMAIIEGQYQFLKLQHCFVLPGALRLTMTIVNFDITLMVPLLDFTSYITLTGAKELV